VAAGIQGLDCAGRTKRSHSLRELLREMNLKHVKHAIQAPGFAWCFGEA
jgi:hypothetical protein